jgi:peptidoglycan hydrolase-like protein with peptidoglycan-binding domain
MQMPTYKVAQGDCLSSIAERFGFFPDALWSLPENAELKQKRKDPNVLYPGDSVFVPDLRPKEAFCGTDQRHSFRKKGVPAKLKLRLMDDDQPRKTIPYQLEIDGRWLSGATDGDGYLEHPIPPSARKGKLLVGEGPTKDVYELQFGTLDPIETEEGVRGRLTNLGYAGENLSEALKAFQQRTGLPMTGEIDAALRTRLREDFGQ